MSETFNNGGRGPWSRDGGPDDVILPQSEPEVRMAQSRNTERAAWVKLAKGVVAIFVLGLMLGSCVAGVILPIKFVGWLFP